MADPTFAVELGNVSMLLEKPITRDPKKLLPANKVLEIARSANDFAFTLFPHHFLCKVDPMQPENMQLLPVMISTIAYDWIAESENVSTDDYKAALF